jgi:hypothetical protein
MDGSISELRPTDHVCFGSVPFVYRPNLRRTILLNDPTFLWSSLLLLGLLIMTAQGVVLLACVERSSKAIDMPFSISLVTSFFSKRRMVVVLRWNRNSEGIVARFIKTIIPLC